MRAPVAFAVALASAAGLAVALVILPGSTSFESATGFSAARKATDLLLMAGILYGFIFVIAGCLSVVPFTVSFLMVERACPAWVAAVSAGTFGALAALVPFASLRRWASQDAMSWAASYGELLPGAVLCGLFGGLVFVGSRHAAAVGRR